ncbi:MAG: protein arginine kinase [Clostridia bacterium]|nr:protein arginine kinase [Clostridia bacterium]
MSSWYQTNGPQDDIAVSSRIRLARNLSGIPFPARMTNLERAKLNAKVKKAIMESNTPFAKSLKYIDMRDVPETQKYAMVERHIISPEFAKLKDESAVILSSDESISIMIGEEDHIRIQVITSGLQLSEAYDVAERIDSLLHGSLQFAFDSNLGFLTECPTNLGTGLRASVMLHLPALENSGEIGELSSSIAKIGFTVRGMYGEGSKSAAALYQVSNQVTLGLSEKNALENLNIITTQLMEKELESRKKIDTISLEDICFRALATLKNARILSSSEMMQLISRVKLGQSMGILKIDALPIKVLVEAQPFMLMQKYGILEPKDRDIYRANMVREAFG